MHETSRRIFGVYARLRQHFGYRPDWWPGGPLEVALSALLVQRCDWSPVWKAVEELQAAGLGSLEELAATSPDLVRELIRKVTFAPTKSRRMVQFAQALVSRGHRRIETLLADPFQQVRHELLALKGIGQETADCIGLFGGAHPVFVIDGYTRRIFQRLNLDISGGDGFWSRPYKELQGFFEQHILADLSLYDCFDFDRQQPRAVAIFRDFHAQLVELGKHHCRKKNPCCHAQGREGWKDYDFCEDHCRECRACPLADVCRFAGAKGTTENPARETRNPRESITKTRKTKSRNKTPL